MNILDNKIQKFWEASDSHISHTSYDYIKGNPDKWKEQFLNKIDLKDKTVIDYGTGMGLLGKVLFDDYNIKEYIGIDIAKRQLNIAKQTLQDYNCKFYQTPKEFSTINADVFISLATIQHFVSENYLCEFLKNVNDSGCSTVVLQIRYSEEVKFINDFEHRQDILFACCVNDKYLFDKLTNYKNIYTSSVLGKANYMYLIYTLK